MTLSAFAFGFWEFSKASIVAKAVDDHRHISAATLSSSWNVEPPLYFVREVARWFLTQRRIAFMCMAVPAVLAVLILLCAFLFEITSPLLGFISKPLQ